MKKSKISKSRRKLLSALNENARISYSSLSKEFRTSPQNIRATVQSLQEVLVPYTLVDHAILNLLLFKVYFKGGFADEKELGLQSKALAKSELVTDINELSGPYDLQVNFMSPNPSRFNKELKEIIGVRPSLNTFDIVINVVSHIYPSIFSIQTDEIKEFVIGGDRKPKIPDEKEHAVLKVLVEEPKSTIVNIAEKTNLNVRTVINVMKQLEKDHIIRGYRTEFNYSEMDYLHHRIILTLHNTNIERDKALQTFCGMSKNIIKFSKTVGRWDIEIDVITATNKEFRKLYLNLREEFKDIIQSFNYFVIEKKFKKSYIPAQFFNNYVQISNKK